MTCPICAIIDTYKVTTVRDAFIFGMSLGLNIEDERMRVLSPVQQMVYSTLPPHIRSQTIERYIESVVCNDCGKRMKELAEEKDVVNERH